MKLLLDACVWGKAGDALTAAGHDLASVSTWGEDPGDEQILEWAHAERRVLVTLDKDFGELAVHQGKPHCGIIRLMNIPTRLQAPVCGQVLKTHSSELQAGAIVTVDTRRLRLRLPP